jgi:hypothetical protein
LGADYEAWLQITFLQQPDFDAEAAIVQIALQAKDTQISIDT